jgi:hypothetical protein
VIAYRVSRAIVRCLLGSDRSRRQFDNVWDSFLVDTDSPPFDWTNHEADIVDRFAWRPVKGAAHGS